MFMCIYDDIDFLVNTLTHMVWVTEQIAPSDVDTMSVRSFPSEHSVSSGFGAMIEEK